MKSNHRGPRVNSWIPRPTPCDASPSHLEALLSRTGRSPSVYGASGWPTWLPRHSYERRALWPRPRVAVDGFLRCSYLHLTRRDQHNPGTVKFCSADNLCMNRIVRRVTGVDCLLMYNNRIYDAENSLYDCPS
jgi:hypothetical protein